MRSRRPEETREINTDCNGRNASLEWSEIKAQFTDDKVLSCATGLSSIVGLGALSTTQPLQKH